MISRRNGRVMKMMNPMRMCFVKARNNEGLIMTKTDAKILLRMICVTYVLKKKAMMNLKNECWSLPILLYASCFKQNWSKTVLIYPIFLVGGYISI